jgi:lipoprotein-releasing system permease protein
LGRAAADAPHGGGEEEVVDAGPDDEEPPPDFSGEPDGGPEVDGGVEAELEEEEEVEEEPVIFDGTDAGPEPDAGPRKKRPLSGIDPRTAGLDGLIVGKELLKNLHLWIGAEVQVVSGEMQVTPTGEVPRTRSFRVAGSFFSGMFEYDTKFTYVSLPALQSFLSVGDTVTGIEIKVANMNDTAPVLEALKARLGDGYYVQDWKELNRNLFSALKLEKIAMFLVLTIIIFVASFSIISNLIMIVVEKAREIAILKSMGASDGGVMRVFMIEGLYIGLLGTVFGITFGVATCIALEVFGLPLDPDVYYINKLPVAMDGFAVMLVGAAGVAISFIATIYPSYVAAKLRPVDGLRYE